MRKYIGRAILILFLLAAVPAAGVSAAEGDGLKVDDKGKVTLTSSYAAQEGISSVCFSLSVNSESAEDVRFHFDESAAKIQEFRYDKENKKLNVYIAGTEALIKEGNSLSVGSIEVLNANGGVTSAEVSVTAGSLMYVYGTELKWMADLETPGWVEVNASAQEPDSPDSGEPTPTPAPTSDPAPDPAPDPTPDSTPQPTKTPQAVPTPWPVEPYQPNIVRPTATPRPTETPEPSATPAPEPSEAPETEDEDLEEPESTEVMLPQEGDEGGSMGEDGETAGGIDWVFVIAIAAIVMFIVVAVMAVVILKKKPSKH